MRSLYKVLLPVALLANAPPPDGDYPPPPLGVTSPQTKDRYTPDAMRTLIGDAATMLDDGKLNEAQANVEKRVRGLADVNVTGDTFEAFGVLAYSSEAGDEAARKRIALDFLQRAVGAYRHPGGDPALLALALNSLGDALDNEDADDTSTASVAAVEEAYQVRLKHLGPNDGETAFTLASLANLQGRPTRTGRDPAKIEAVAARFRQAIETEAAAKARQPHDYIFIRNMFARFYARNGMAPQAWAVLDRTRTAYHERFRTDADSCGAMTYGTGQLSTSFDAAGLKDDAARASALSVQMRDTSCGA